MSLVAASANRLLLSLSLVAVGCWLAPQNLLAQRSASIVAAIPSLITQRVDESQRTVLKGNTHPLARREFDLGSAPASLPMQRMLLVLKRSPGQETALRQLLDDQQNKNSSSYHQWLTPAQYGKQFGPTDADMQTVTTWLQSHGFQVGTTKGRTVLEFSGTAGQVQEAFQTSIHKYIVNGEQHWANASDPSIPTALTPAVAGIATLHNFLKKPDVIFSKQRITAKTQPGERPALTFSNGVHGIAPLDFATIYDSPAYNGGASGGFVTIGVIGRSNVYNGGEDISDFRSSEAFNICCGNFAVTVNGADPGDLGGGEEVEATLDSTWSGAVAPNAIIELVVSASTNTADGIDLSEVYIVENNFADIMTESFSGCEAFASSSSVTFTSQMAEQAAAQGITYFVSTGDNGAEGCDDPDTETVATGPVSVSLLASTPFNIAVGGTVLNDSADPGKYWSTSNTNQESALSYIPENVWNDSCTGSNCASDVSANIVAGSGGSSKLFTRPPWQTGVTGAFDSGGMRDLPDVSLTASGFHDGYVLCLEGSCVPNSQGEFFLALVGGTSASAPSFAGIMALVDEQFSNVNPGLGPRQGVANYTLYKLATTENSTFSQCNASNTTTLPTNTCVFNDVTVGNNAVPGEFNYGSSTADYQAAAGYDMATGLGSVNVTNLVNQWSSSTLIPTTTTLNITYETVTHGSSVPFSVSVTPTNGTGTPTGNISLLVARQGGELIYDQGVGTFSLNAGSAASSTNSLPGGPIFVAAYYAGDATYAPSLSAMTPMELGPEPSTTALSVLTFNASGVQSTFTTGPFGSFIYLRADVAGLSGYGTPTGSVTFTDTFGTIPGGTSSGLTLGLNSGDNFQSGSYTATPNGIITFDVGTHAISAAYGGDASFNPSSTTQPQSFIITPGFYTTIGSNATVVVSAPGQGGSVPFSVTNSTGFSGTISFSCSNLPTATTCSFTPATVTANGTLATTNGTLSVDTDTSSAALHSPRIHLQRFLVAGNFAFFSILLIGSPRRRRASISLLALLVFAIFMPACGSGSSSTPPPPPPSTSAGTYTIQVNATSGSTTSTTAFTLIVE